MIELCLTSGIIIFKRFSHGKLASVKAFNKHKIKYKIKILDCMNRLKSRFFEKIDFFIFLKILPITIIFANPLKKFQRCQINS
jgi:hypothetical protein